jgi:hypothetical protein
MKTNPNYINGMVLVDDSSKVFPYEKVLVSNNLITGFYIVRDGVIKTVYPSEEYYRETK